jgi:hypothetical protein
LLVFFGHVARPPHRKPETKYAEPGIMVACPRSTMTNSRPSAGCGRLRPIVVVEVVSNDPGHDLAAPQGEPIRGARMPDPRRMTPEEHGQAHALLVEAVSDPDWQAARQALEELMRKLLVVHRLLEAEERLAKREPPADPA